MRNENKFAELQACDSDMFSELGQIVLVRVADLFDDSVKAQSLEESRYLPAGGSVAPAFSSGCEHVGPDVER